MAIIRKKIQEMLHAEGLFEIFFLDDSLMRRIAFLGIFFLHHTSVHFAYPMDQIVGAN